VKQVAKHLVDVVQLDQDSIQHAFRLNERTQKIMTFVFPLVQNGVLGPMCKFPFQGLIMNIDAYCSVSGVEDTVIDIEKIAEPEFEAGLDTWESIFGTQKLTIPANFNKQDYAYNFSTNAVDPNDLFRVNFINTGPIAIPIDNLRVRELTIQITIAI
jgi:hypothetical protein